MDDRRSTGEIRLVEQALLQYVLVTVVVVDVDVTAPDTGSNCWHQSGDRAIVVQASSK